MKGHSLSEDRAKYLLWLIAAAWIYTLSFIIDNYWSKFSSFQAVTKTYQQQLSKNEGKFEDFIKDSDLLKRLAFGSATTKDFESLNKQPVNLFLYNTSTGKPKLVFWSTSVVQPPWWVIESGKLGNVLKYGNGEYEILRKNITINGLPHIAIGLILLHQEFFIENSRLRSEFPGFEGLEKRVLYSISPTPYPVYGTTNEVLFYFKPGNNAPFKVFSWSSVIIQLIATLILIITLSRIANQYISRGRTARGLWIFGLGFITLWVLVGWLGFPLNVGSFSFLETQNMLSMPPETLLSLFQNLLFGIWLALFITFAELDILEPWKQARLWVKIVFGSMLTIAGLAIHFSGILIISRLYLNTSVAFDLNNFFSLDYTTALAFVLLFGLAITHLLLLRFMVRGLLVLTNGSRMLILVVIAVVGLSFLSFPWLPNFKVQLLMSLLWLLMFAWYFLHQNRPALPVASGRLLVWLFLYAVSIGMLLSVLSTERLKTRVRELGKTLLLQNDQTSEYLVRIAAVGAKRVQWKDILEQSRDSIVGNQLRDSIKSKYFSGYLDRFVTDIYLFDRDQQPVNNEDALGFGSLQTLYSSNMRLPDLPWLSYFEEAFDRFGFIMRYDVVDDQTGEELGTAFIVTRSVVSKNSMLAPELFKQIQDFAVDLPQGFSYAWYNKGVLVEQYRNYAFSSSLPKELNELQSYWENETETGFELWLDAETDTVLAVAGERQLMVGLVSLIAYIFCAFLVLFLLLRGISVILQQSAFQVRIFRKFNLTIQAQIRLTIISILIISFLIIALITIRFFIGQYKSSNEDRLSRTIQNVHTDLSKSLPNGFGGMSESRRSAIMQEQLQRINKTIDADINFYNPAGAMMATTQNVLFVKEVISPLINPLAYQKLTQGRIHRFIAEETIGDLEYISIYQPLRDGRRNLLGYLQIPYFASQSELNQEISNFVVILINIIAFVFLLSGGLALWISGGITRSFSIIADKMNQIRLSEKNERIEWSSKDEIGNLIDQYNRMVDQLESSAALLAKSERELAWREMAQQVAHEIKNPLTPMKLSLQYLQKTITDNKGDVGKVSHRVAGTLVSQIDHLSRIASDFSQFANIGNTKPEVFNLHSILKDLVQLYQLQENVHVFWNPADRPVYINADRTQINRLFTNIFQNAYEARDPDGILRIRIDERIKGNHVTISVSDNGPGIASSLQTKIFEPNFTTKTSGTGLGLAICKAIVENASGNIWFETSPEVGTVFHVELPVAD